jgi:ribosome-associated protein
MDNLIRHNINKINLLKELIFKATRSSGKGGQNVNKVSTKVTLIFDIDNSAILNPDLKRTIKNHLRTKITAGGILKLSVSKERYQSVNKSIALKKFLFLINMALEPEELRIKTKPGKISIRKRLSDKANLAAKKKLRSKKPELDE